MNTYNPMQAAYYAAVAELTSEQAQQFYRNTALEFLYCFGEGLLVLISGTVRLGQLTGDCVHNWLNKQYSGKALAVTQRLLTGVTPIALLPAQTPKPNTSAVSTETTLPRIERNTPLVDRMISVVDTSVIGKPKPKTARSGRWHQCNTNIVFGIDGKTVKELRAMAKEQGYRNTSKLTKAELLGLLA
jgi:hypothetical protein